MSSKEKRDKEMLDRMIQVFQDHTYVNEEESKQINDYNKCYFS